MNREELFKDLGLDTTKMTTEELFRQTGRSIRMLEAAIASARNGKQTLIVVKDETEAESLRFIRDISTQYSLYSVSIVGYNPLTAETDPIFDWKTLKGVGKFSDYEVFIDHDVIYFNNRHLFEAFSKYDPKVKINGNSMTFAD